MNTIDGLKIPTSTEELINFFVNEQVKLLDIIIFHERNSKNNFKAQIIELSWFPSFEEAIKTVGIKKVLPNAHSLKDGIKIYESFPHKEGNYKKGAKKYGVLRMKFKLL